MPGIELNAFGRTKRSRTWTRSAAALNGATVLLRRVDSDDNNKEDVEHHHDGGEAGAEHDLEAREVHLKAHGRVVEEDPEENDEREERDE